MISKERLEELIKEGATIWHNDFGEITLDEGCEICEVRSMNGVHIQWVLCFEYEYNNKKQWEELDIEELEENVESAKWHYEMDARKSYWLKFPTWKEIENIIEQKKKFGLNHSDRVLARIITGDSIYYLKLCKDLDLFTLQLKQTYIGDDLCEEITTRFPYMFGIATKENYEKACRKCKEIFLGCSDGDIQ